MPSAASGEPNTRGHAYGEIGCKQFYPKAGYLFVNLFAGNQVGALKYHKQGTQPNTKGRKDVVKHNGESKLYAR